MYGERATSELPFASVSNRVFVQNHSYGNMFHLEVHFHANQTYFHMKGFGRRLVLKQRHKETRKWPLKELVHALRAYL